MAKLKEEFKRKWIAALRSGEYPQGTERLECGGKYCCLGVALKVQYPEADPDEHFAFMTDDELPSKYDASAWWEVAPSNYDQINNPVVIVEGLDDEGEKSLVPQQLSELNDEEGYTFAQIADIIEAQL